MNVPTQGNFRFSLPKTCRDWFYVFFVEIMGLQIVLNFNLSCGHNAKPKCTICFVFLFIKQDLNLFISRQLILASSCKDIYAMIYLVMFFFKTNCNSVCIGSIITSTFIFVILTFYVNFSCIWSSIYAYITIIILFMILLNVFLPHNYQNTAFYNKITSLLKHN